MSLYDPYVPIVGEDAIAALRDAAKPLEGSSLVHVNSTREGGGVAEILNRMVPLMADLGLKVSWEVIDGEGVFFDATKSIHNGLQGDPVEFGPELIGAWEATCAENARRLRPTLEAADAVIIHDPQPAPLIGLCPGRSKAWIWRCHIHAGGPHPPVWNAVREHAESYEASIFHMPDFVQPMAHEQVLMPPSIDPLSDKNRDLSDEEVAEVCRRFELDTSRPMVVQISRFDRFKDPIGCIEAYQQAKRHTDLQLVLAGGGASDDPEGAEVLAEVRQRAGNDPDIKVLMLPSDAHIVINALQRAADVVLQKSLKEGFGLTVSEAMWKGRPVIGGDVGGIRLQIEDGDTGYLVRSPSECAARIVTLLDDGDAAAAMGARAREHVRANFLITRHIRDYLELIRKLRGL